MDGLPLELPIFLVATFAGALVAGLSGFAFGLVAASIWLYILTPLHTASLIIAFGLIDQGYSVWKLCYFDYGFRHFWTSKKPIIEPKDLRGAKIRVQQAKIFGDTISGLGGNAVPMAWGEVITAAKQG